MSHDLPYAGIRVIDLSQGIAGPYCALLFAQHGAEVIKIEPPEGDWARLIGDRFGDHTAFSVIGNLGKRGLVLDLKTDAGKAVLDRALEGADLFIENFRPGVADRLGFGPDRLRARHPSLIYVSISGFGTTGPMRERPAMDPMLQAFTGFMAENRSGDGTPLRVPVVIFDMATALFAFQAASAALYARRDAPPGGRLIETSLMQGAACLQAIRMMATVMNGAPLNTVVVPGGTFRTADGWIQLAAIRDRDFVRLCEVFGLDDLRADPRFATGAGRVPHGEFIHRRIAEVTQARTSADLADALAKAGLQGAAVLDYLDFAAHPQTAANGLFSPVPQPGDPVAWPLLNLPGLAPFSASDPRSLAPVRGQDSDAVLADLGHDPEEIAALRAAGIVAGPGPGAA